MPLPVAYRSLSRPSSAPDAKAFPLRSFQLDLVAASTACSFSPGSQELCRHNFTEESSAFVAFTLLKFPQRASFFCCLLSHFWNVFFVVQFSRCNLWSLVETRYKLSISLRTCICPHWWTKVDFVRFVSRLCVSLREPRNRVVGQSGLEPPTSRLSVVCSSQLSYWPVWWRLPDSNR